jgi:hypothetical protein
MLRILKISLEFIGLVCYLGFVWFNREEGEVRGGEERDF